MYLVECERFAKDEMQKSWGVEVVVISRWQKHATGMADQDNRHDAVTQACAGGLPKRASVQWLARQACSVRVKKQQTW